jgi:hypothetical protein
MCATIAPPCRDPSAGYSWGKRKLLLNAPTLGVSSPPAAHRQLLALHSFCHTWNAVIAFSFLCFAAYAASAVYAGLDLKGGKGLVTIKQRQGTVYR